MKTAFPHFMSGLIDHAGIFPPADVDAATALAYYADLLEGDDGWMLGRYADCLPHLQNSLAAIAAGAK